MYHPSKVDRRFISLYITIIHFCAPYFLCRLRSIAAHRDHFVRRLSVCACVCLSGSHTSPHKGGPCECDRVYTVAYFFVKLGRHVNHDERMHPIDYRGQRSKVKVTMDIYGNKLVNTIQT